MQNKSLIGGHDRNVVYIKEVTASDVPPSISLDAMDGERIFALHDAQGEQLAVAANRELAVHLARANDLVPMAIQ